MLGTAQRTVLQRYGYPDVSLELIANKDDYELSHVPDTSIRAIVKEWWQNTGWHNPDLQRASATAASVIRSRESPPGQGGFHVPKNLVTEKAVGPTTYAFYNDANGYLDFKNPQNHRPPCPDAGGTWDVNIRSALGTVKHTGNALASGKRYDHFKSANIEREGHDPPAYGGASPPGWTWHHHADTGRMQLIDRAVHAAFPHRGGFSKWGS